MFFSCCSDGTLVVKVKDYPEGSSIDGAFVSVDGFDSGCITYSSEFK